MQSFQLVMVTNTIDCKFDMWQVSYYIKPFTCVVSYRPFRDPLRELLLLNIPIL